MSKEHGDQGFVNQPDGIPEGVSPETAAMARKAYQDLIASGEIPDPHKSVRNPAPKAEKTGDDEVEGPEYSEVEEPEDDKSEADNTPTEQGVVVPPERRPREESVRTTGMVRVLDNKATVIVKPRVIKMDSPAGISPTTMSINRQETHQAAAHGVARPLSKFTGWVDGGLDAVVNGVAEISETLVFGFSKFVHGLRHGWERGKFHEPKED